MEKTFVAIKPDAVQRGLVGELIQKFEKKGFKIIGLKFLQADRELAEKHYADHKGKPFFEPLVEFLISGPMVVMVLEGPNAIALTRKFIGATHPMDADSGTVRGDYAHTKERNIVHAADSQESAEKEIKLYFKDEELISGWNRDLEERFIEF